MTNVVETVADMEGFVDHLLLERFHSYIQEGIDDIFFVQLGELLYPETLGSIATLAVKNQASVPHTLSDNTRINVVVPTRPEIGFKPYEHMTPYPFVHYPEGVDIVGLIIVEIPKQKRSANNMRNETGPQREVIFVLGNEGLVCVTDFRRFSIRGDNGDTPTLLTAETYNTTYTHGSTQTMLGFFSARDINGRVHRLQQTHEGVRYIMFNRDETTRNGVPCTPGSDMAVTNTNVRFLNAFLNKNTFGPPDTTLIHYLNQQNFIQIA